MHFLPDIYVPCEVCKGKRYNRETLEVRYKGKNIYEVLEMTVEEALPFFENLPRIYGRLKTLMDVGLSYIKLGQPSTELSGGEAQRVKLATELSKRSTGQTIYILDEPTTGLHSYDVHRLIEVDVYKRQAGRQPILRRGAQCAPASEIPPLTEIGEITERAIQRIPNHYPYVFVEKYPYNDPLLIIMRNKRKQ